MIEKNESEQAPLNGHWKYVLEHKEVLDVWPVSSPERGFRKREYGEEEAGSAWSCGWAKSQRRSKLKRVLLYARRDDSDDDDDERILSVLVQIYRKSLTK